MEKKSWWQRLLSFGWKGVEVWSVLISIGVPSMVVGIFHEVFKGWNWYYITLLFGGMVLFLLGILTFIVSRFKSARQTKAMPELTTGIEGIQQEITGLKTEVGKLVGQQNEQKKISTLSDREIELTIREWIDIPGLSIERKEPKDKLLFDFQCTDSAQRIFHIRRSTDNLSQIAIIARLNLRLETATDSLRDSIVRNLALEMARFGIEFLYETEKEKPQFLILIKGVPLDNLLTAYLFRQELNFVVRAMICVTAITIQLKKDAGFPTD